MIITTKRTKSEGRNQKAEYLCFVTITDGIHAARCISDGGADVNIDRLALIENNLGSQFFPCCGALVQNPNFGTRKNLKGQIQAALDFINDCVDIPVRFGEFELTYII